MVAIGIDYTPAYEQGAGIGRTVRGLVSALATIDTTTDYRLFVAGANIETLPSILAPNFAYRPSRISPKWWARIWHRVQIPYAIENILGKISLYHATDFVLPPIHKKTKSLVTIHDLSFVRVPETASPSLKKYLDVVVPRSIMRATHIHAVSEATRQDIITLYNTPPSKISVIFNALEPHFKPTPPTAELFTKYAIPSVPYIVTVGTVQPRKNYSRLVKALVQLRKHHDMHLVVAGGRGWLEDEFYATIRDTGMTDNVHVTGFVADSDLPALYSGAICMAFPSVYEGFGIPPLEAMACGVPVVSSNTSSLPEVVEEAALLIDPYSVDDIHNALERVITDQELRDTLITRGFIQAKKFTWEKSAHQLHHLYRQLLEDK
ncbi:MAG: glycosyltransferase family 1 protein [Phototrophicales bacterium]|nr:glycosyltransferase family 1 protein [Phototrophicales bacterium]